MKLKSWMYTHMEELTAYSAVAVTGITGLIVGYIIGKYDF